MKVFALLLAISFLSVPVLSNPIKWKQRNHKQNGNYQKNLKKTGSVLYSRNLVESMSSEQQKRAYKNRKRITLHRVPEYRVKVKYSFDNNYQKRNTKFRFNK